MTVNEPNKERSSGAEINGTYLEGEYRGVRVS